MKGNYKKGFIDGEEKGIEKEKYDTTKILILKGFTIEEISEITGLTKKQILEFKKKISK